jgi:S-formylglutathione hydrolase FrmB
MEDQKKIITIPFDGKSSSYLAWTQKVWCYFCL